MTKKSKLGKQLQSQFKGELNALKKSMKEMGMKSAKRAVTKAATTVISAIPNPALRAGASEVANRLIKLWGSGDYLTSPNPQANTLLRPTSVLTVGNEIRVRNREFVGEVYNDGTSTFLIANKLPINPALPNVFPFLSQIASNYENYTMKGLVYEYVSMVSPYQTSNMGSIMMSWQDNPDAKAYSSKIAMENSEGAISGRPDQHILYAVECDDQKFGHFMCRTGSTTKDLGLFDYGIMQIAAQSALTGVLGELWVSYDVVLSRPKLYSTPSVISAYFSSSTGGKTATASGGYFGTAQPTSVTQTGRVAFTYDGGSAKFTFTGLVPGDVIAVTIGGNGTGIQAGYALVANTVSSVSTLSDVSSTYLGVTLRSPGVPASPTDALNLGYYQVSNVVTPYNQPSFTVAASTSNWTSMAYSYLSFTVFPATILL